MKKSTIKQIKKTGKIVRKNAEFINSILVILLISLFALSFRSEKYIDIFYICGFILLSILSYTLSLRQTQIAAVAICNIGIAGLLLLVGYSDYAQVFSQWAYMFLIFVVGYNIIFYLLHKKELAK